MHLPKYFELKDTQQMIQVIQDHSLATLVTLSSKGLIANHIPMIVIKKDDHYYLQGHVAKANSLWKDHDNSLEVMALFNGPNAYISPNWYPDKKIDHKQVPTWNYVTVHASGILSFFHDKSWLKQHLDQLVNTHEKAMPNPWELSDAPDDYIQKMLNGIVGLEIKISKLTGKSKMSQNHPEHNRKGVCAGLLTQDQANVAKWVEKPNG